MLTQKHKHRRTRTTWIHTGGGLSSGPLVCSARRREYNDVSAETTVGTLSGHPNCPSVVMQEMRWNVWGGGKRRKARSVQDGGEETSAIPLPNDSKPRRQGLPKKIQAKSEPAAIEGRSGENVALLFAKPPSVAKRREMRPHPPAHTHCKTHACTHTQTQA